MNPVIVHDMRVRPAQAALLSFETDGIVGESNVQLGASVTKFDFTTFYANLGNAVSGTPSRLSYDSTGILSDPSINASLLYALRAESKRAVLDKAVANRQNAYYAKYQNAAAVISMTKQSYDPTVSGSKPQRLAALANISQQQANDLNAAYTADSRLGVVKTTTGQLNSTTNSCGQSNTAGGNVGSTNSTVSGFDDTFSFGTDASGSSLAVTNDNSFDTTFNSGFALSSSGSWGQTHSSGRAAQVQQTSNMDYAYRVPSLEAEAQNERAQISLIDEQFAQFMFAQNIPYLSTVFANELVSIDSDVKRLQVAYMNTLLMSPIDGIVTGVYKRVGEYVKAGEPVLRVEDDTNVFLIGTITYHGSIEIGDSVQINTSLYGSSALPIMVTGTVMAARGRRKQDELWDVVISCSNTGGSGPIFPLNYHFDYDDTSALIS
ncbi:MAG TPA: HlyD family secretion protein [Verrucomicrobiae bacterium]|nr:HlyD family secretion protein [Verrucomicrobiae bacterium]